MYQNIKHIRFFTSFILILVFNFAFAQNYPVQITTILTPPFSGYISDYSAVGNPSCKLVVLFNDFTKPSYNIKLKFKLSGQNINIESKNFYYEGPFTLIPGVPLEIEGSDIAGLLNSNNLDFTGLSKQQYESSKVLPEGLYTLTFTAYDFNNPTAIQVSNQGSFSAWMLLNDPPYLNIPFCGNVQPVTNPQNIIFQWTSMNLISPNSANNTEYEFSLYEVRPKGANPNNILQTLPPIYQTTTNITTLNYGLTEPVLNVGMDYVWRVKAIDLTGRDLFKNQGYSQLCTFTYGNMSQFIDSSAISITLHGLPLNYRLAKCFWDTLNVYKNYRLYYRKQNGTNWFTNSNIPRSYDLLQNLEASNTYEAYVKGVLLDDSEGPASNTVTIHTPAKTDYVCGQTQGMLPTQNKPLTLATVGQIWEVGQFEIVITSIDIPVSPLGLYSGYGKVAIPFLGNANYNVKFNNIFVNEEFQVISGRVDVVTEGIGNWLHNIDVLNAEQNATYVNGTITGFSVTGSQYCYTVQATNTQICDTLPTNGNVFVVRDENGNQYTVNLKPPPPTVTGPTSYLNYSTDNLDASDSMLVTFNASAIQNFGFDKKEYAAFTENYEVIKLKNTKNYFVSNKSIGENQTDEVLAQVQVIGFNASQLAFKTSAGANLTATNEGNNIFKITGIPANATCVYAWYNTKKIGKLNISNLKAITKKVVLVPVNNANVSVSAAQLNEIFKQANVNWTVTNASNFTFNLGNDGLEAADANLMSKYSTEMRALRDAYKLFDTLYDKAACYVFVVPNFTNPNLKGYMVRGRALGFVSSAASIKEIAHELAHGAFGLEHTFPKIIKATSNNLMDYTASSHLIKLQWNLMHLTNSNFSWFDDEEDAAYYSLLYNNNSALGVHYWINKIKIAYKKNTQVLIPENLSLIGKAKKCVLGGIEFPFVDVYVANVGPGVYADVKNKVTIGPASIITGNTPLIQSCVLVDNGKIIIHTAPGFLNALKTYIESDTFKNLILFVNGYRPVVNMNGDPIKNSLTEYDDSNNEIEAGDSRNYWKGINAQFMNRIGTRQAAYADGHHSVSTSNHGSVGSYAAANLSSEIAKEICEMLNGYGTLGNGQDCSSNSYLHTSPNSGGFLIRQNNGDKAALDLISKINQGIVIFNKTTDTLDIVSHSMGYAYAVGMIKRLKSEGIKFGRFYIIAPENPSSGGDDWTNFTEVWQYGSNLGESPQDPFFLQDGVAPQCAVKGIEGLPDGNTKGGRVFIPATVTTKSFLGSHSIANYGWIFNIQNQAGPGGYGYVKARN